MDGDFCDAGGARVLKAKIENYWTSRGFDVAINLVEAGFLPAMRSARTDVRSNMVNGMPPRKKSAWEQKIEEMAARPPVYTHQISSRGR